MLLAPDRNHDFVEVPFVGRCGTVAPDLGCDLGTEPLTPHPNAFIGDDNAPLSQQILDVAQAQGKTMIRLDSVRDDGTGKAVALQAGL